MKSRRFSEEQIIDTSSRSKWDEGGRSLSDARNQRCNLLQLTQQVRRDGSLRSQASESARERKQTEQRACDILGFCRDAEIRSRLRELAEQRRSSVPLVCTSVVEGRQRDQPQEDRAAIQGGRTFSSFKEAEERSSHLRVVLHLPNRVNQHGPWILFPIASSVAVAFGC
jgi:hypothetical protein